jgi:hypothetical protein
LYTLTAAQLDEAARQAAAITHARQRNVLTFISRNLSASPGLQACSTNTLCHDDM